MYKKKINAQTVFNARFQMKKQAKNIVPVAPETPSLPSLTRLPKNVKGRLARELIAQNPSLRPVEVVRAFKEKHGASISGSHASKILGEVKKNGYGDVLKNLGQIAELVGELGGVEKATSLIEKLEKVGTQKILTGIKVLKTLKSLD